MLLAGLAGSAAASWFKRGWHYLLFLQVKRPVSLGLVGETGLFCLWVCGLTKVMPAGNYFEFLMWRVAVAVSPSPVAAIPASAIALGAVSPVFASLPAVVFACLPLLEFACLVELC